MDMDSIGLMTSKEDAARKAKNLSTVIADYQETFTVIEKVNYTKNHIQNLHIYFSTPNSVIGIISHPQFSSMSNQIKCLVK